MLLSIIGVASGGTEKRKNSEAVPFFSVFGNDNPRPIFVRSQLKAVSLCKRFVVAANHRRGESRGRVMGEELRGLQPTLEVNRCSGRRSTFWFIILLLLIMPLDTSFFLAKVSFMWKLKSNYNIVLSLSSSQSINQVTTNLVTKMQQSAKQLSHNNQLCVLIIFRISCVQSKYILFKSLQDICYAC